MAKSTVKFGKIGHIGIVVKDLEEARARYSAFLGTDKWYELVYDAPPELYYLGSKRECNVRLLFGGKGHTVIELIETVLPFGMHKGDMPCEVQLAAMTGNYKRVK